MFTLRMIHKLTPTVPLRISVGNYYVGHLNIYSTLLILLAAEVGSIVGNVLLLLH